WSNQQAVARLVAKAPAGLSPRLLNVVGVLLGKDDPLQVAWRRRAQAQHPADFWLAFGLANVLVYTDPAEAAVWYRVALAIRPTSPVTYNNLGAVLRNQGKLDEAVAACLKAIELDPKFAPARANLGNALCDQRKLDEGVAAHRKAI